MALQVTQNRHITFELSATLLSPELVTPDSTHTQTYSHMLTS